MKEANLDDEVFFGCNCVALHVKKFVSTERHQFADRTHNSFVLFFNVLHWFLAWKRSNLFLIYQVNSYFVRALEKDKLSLEKQIRDMEWRLDHESKVRVITEETLSARNSDIRRWSKHLWFLLANSKAYHKANEERKHFLLEIKGVGVQIGENKLKRDREQTDRPTPREYVSFMFMENWFGTNFFEMSCKFLSVVVAVRWTFLKIREFWIQNADQLKRQQLSRNWTNFSSSRVERFFVCDAWHTVFTQTLPSFWQRLSGWSNPKVAMFAQAVFLVLWFFVLNLVGSIVLRACFVGLLALRSLLWCSLLSMTKHVKIRCWHRTKCLIPWAILEHFQFTQLQFSHNWTMCNNTKLKVDSALSKPKQFDIVHIVAFGKIVMKGTNKMTIDKPFPPSERPKWVSAWKDLIFWAGTLLFRSLSEQILHFMFLPLYFADTRDRRSERSRRLTLHNFSGRKYFSVFFKHKFGPCSGCNKRAQAAKRARANQFDYRNIVVLNQSRTSKPQHDLFWSWTTHACFGLQMCPPPQPPKHTHHFGNCGRGRGPPNLKAQSGSFLPPGTFDTATRVFGRRNEMPLVVFFRYNHKPIIFHKSGHVTYHHRQPHVSVSGGGMGLG